MASEYPLNPPVTPLWGSSNFNIGVNLQGMASGLGSQQPAHNQPKAPGAGLKVKKRVIVDDDDDVSDQCSSMAV
jgi:hypothetical protein